MGWLHYFQNRAFTLVDKPKENRASNVAAGILNPITGRNYVLSWNYFELIESAIPFYQKIEKELDQSFLRSIPIFRGIFNQKNLNEWNYRSDMYESYQVMPNLIAADDLQKDQNPSGEYFGEVSQSYQLNIKLFCHASQAFFRNSKNFVELSEVVESEHGDIIYAEGVEVLSDSIFSFIPLRPSKGDVLIIDCSDLENNFILKDKYFICPLWEDNVFWVGSNYDNRFVSDQPSREMGEELLDFLNSYLNVEFKVISHLSAVRPTVPDRRPIVGSHPDKQNRYLFNGLGTKGSSLGPWSAMKLMDHIYKGIDLPQEIDIRRYLNHYPD